MFSKARRDVPVQGAVLGMMPLLTGPLAAAAAAAAAAAVNSTASIRNVRLTLLLGNRNYPVQQEFRAGLR